MTAKKFPPVSEQLKCYPTSIVLILRSHWLAERQHVSLQEYDSQQEIENGHERTSLVTKWHLHRRLRAPGRCSTCQFLVTEILPPSGGIVIEYSLSWMFIGIFIGIVLNIHWKDWCWSWNSNTLTTSCKELTHCKTPWCQERLKVGGEGENRGWDGWMVSPI